MSKKNKQNSLQASVGFVHAIDFLDDPIYLLDLDSNIVAGNKAYFKRIGKSPDEAIGTSASQHVHAGGEDIPCPVCQARLDRRDAFITLEADDPQNYSDRSMELEIKVVRDKNNEPIGIIQRTRDLTATREAEEALRTSEARLRLMTNQAPAILWVTDTDLRFTSVLGSALKNLGLKQNEMVGMSLQEYFHSDGSRHPGIAITNDALKGGSGSYEFEKADRIYHVHVEPQRNIRNEIIGTLGVALDITDKRSSELRYMRLLEASSDSVLIIDNQGKIVMANSVALELFGYRRSELIGNHVEKLLPKQIREKHVGLRNEYIDNPSVRRMGKRKELTALHADGHDFPVDISLSPLQTDAGVYTSALVRDITQQLKIEREMERLASFPELSPNPIVEIDTEGHPTYMNPAAVDLFPDLVKLKFEHPALYGVAGFIDELAAKGEALVRDIEINGKVYEQQFSYIPDINLIRMYVWDITKMRDLTRKMAYQATHDSLTGLINRSEFERRVNQEIQTAAFDNREHALCYLDLDQFKIINDTCGHVAGDALLKQLSSELRGALRSSDTLARLGGDEFGLLLIGCPLHRAVEIAENLRAVVENLRFDWNGRSFGIGVSIGVVPILPDSGTITDVMSVADVACYIAKDKGRNRVHVYSPDDSELTRHTSEMNWTHRIKQALSEDRFVLFCQEIMPLQTNSSSYYEVLLRMLDDGKIVPPMAFIPAAERYNLMVSIDKWVVRNTFKALRDHVELARFNFAINLSGQSISEDAMMRMIVDELDKTGINPERICFEITETAAVANLVQARRFISILKGLGCRFALDDFGSGVSSFAYLKTLPVDYLKIDGALVKDIENDKVSYAMVESINHVGHVMNIETIAEFVENDKILAKLRLLGVDYAQGYGISKPVPMERLLKEPAKDISTG